MSEEVTEIFLPHIRVSLDLKKAVKDLTYLELKGDKIKLYNLSDVMREALIKGVQLMYMERLIFNELVKSEAKEGALRIQASLVRPAETSQTAVGSEGEESVEKEEIEMEENEEETEEEEEEEE